MNHKFLFSISALGLLTGISTTEAKAETFYQCVACPRNSKGLNGQCYSYESSSNYDIIANPSASKCKAAALPSGEYVVFLRGGKGGSGKDYGGGVGGFLAYSFTVYNDTSYMLCAGGNGGSSEKKEGGGGAGSWLSIGSMYLVVGGGGGGGKVENTSGQGGLGGAIGAGGGGDAGSSDKGGDGGSVGGYKGGISGNCGDRVGCAGQAFNSDNRGCGGHNGNCAGNAIGVELYPGSVRTLVGGYPCSDGKATHMTNTSLKFACTSSSTGCAVLYKFKY